MNNSYLCPCCNKAVKDTDEVCPLCHWTLKTLYRPGELTAEQKLAHQQALEKCKKEHQDRLQKQRENEKRDRLRLQQESKRPDRSQQPGDKDSPSSADHAQLRWRAHSQPIRALAVRPDNTLLASGSTDSTVKLWSLWEWSEQDQGQGSEHAGSVNGLAFVDGGERLLTVSADGRVLQWLVKQRLDARGWTIERVLAKWPVPLTAISYHQGSDTIAVGDNLGAIHVWDRRKDASSARPLTGHGSIVQSVALASGDPLQLASASEDGTLRLWGVGRAPQSRPLWTIGGHIFCVCFSARGELLAGGSSRGLRIWSLRDNSLLVSADRGQSVRSVVFLGANRVACGTQGGSLLLWDIDQGDFIWQKQLASPVLALAVVPSLNFLISGSQNGMIECWALP